jgi:hypothetical protein
MARAKGQGNSKEEAVLRVHNGRVIRLGSKEAFKETANEIMARPGGHSIGGALSFLWFFLTNEKKPLAPEHADRIARQVADFKALYGAGMSERASALLHQLALIASTEHATERHGHDVPVLAPSTSNKVIVAIGDLHGHEPALNQLLAGLQARYGIFEDRNPDRFRRGVTLVFTGDYIDRGKSALAIIEKLRRLGSANPGHLVTLLGNHELLALEAYDDARNLAKLDDGKQAHQLYRSKTCHGQNGGDNFIREFGQGTLPALMSYVARMARNGDIGQWMRALEPCYETRIAKKKVLFMHGDLSEPLHDRKALDRYLRELESHREVGTDKVGGTRAKYGHMLFVGGGSIFWSRSFSKLDDADQASIDNICNSAKVNFIVTGHTPHKTIKTYANRIFDIDVGMTPQCGGNTPQALVFHRDGIMGFSADGTEATFAQW